MQGRPWEIRQGNRAKGGSDKRQLSPQKEREAQKRFPFCSLDCKGHMGKTEVPSDLQVSVNIILKLSRISSSGLVSYLLSLTDAL